MPIAGGRIAAPATALPLDASGDLWHGLTALQDETERATLDKRQALIEGLGTLSGKPQ